MTYKIIVVASVGPADDHRYYYKEIGALTRAGWSVNFFCRDNPPSVFTNLICTVLPKGVRRLTRLTGGLNLLNRVLSWKPDAVQICSVEFLPLAIFLAQFTRVKVFYDCREDMPTSLLEHKTEIPLLFRYGLAKSTLLMEYWGAKVFGGISVSDHWLEEKYRKWGAKNCFLFPNFPRLEDFSGVGGLDEISAKEADFCILGSMSRRTGVIEFVEALGILKREVGWTGKARLIGDPGSELGSELASIARAANVDLEITGRVPYRRVPAELSACKVGVIPLKDMKKFHRNPATKMFEYAAAGLYIVASDLPPQRRYLDQAEFAVLVKPDSAVDLAAGMKEAMILQAADAAGCLPRSRFVENWNADSLYSDLIAYYGRGIA